MGAAPQYATFVFIGLLTKKTYIKDAYLSDVANARINLDSGSGASASSENYWRLPEPCVLRDFSIPTGMTDTTKLQLTKNGIPTGDMPRFANHLNTLSNRPKLAIGFRMGDEFSGIQLAN